MKKTHEIIIKEETLGEAEKIAKTKIPDGFYVIAKEIISDGNEKNIVVTDNTIIDAYLKAEKSLPEDGEIIDKKEITNPGMRTIKVKAFDKQKAEESLMQKLLEYEEIEKISQVKKGRKGFIGIGRKPNIYKGEITVSAVVQIDYVEPAKILLNIKKKPLMSELITELEKLEKDTSNQWLKLDKPIQGEIAALMVMKGAFQYLNEKVSIPFNILLREAKMILSDNEKIKSIMPLNLGAPDRNYDLSDIALVSEQFKEAITSMQKLRNSIIN